MQRPPPGRDRSSRHSNSIGYQLIRSHPSLTIADIRNEIGAVHRRVNFTNSPVVTSLTAEAASFFSCRVGMMGQSGPQDVTCGVYVCRCAVTAALAAEFRLCDAVCDRCAHAALTPVVGVPGIDLQSKPAQHLPLWRAVSRRTGPASATSASIQPCFRPGSVGQELPGLSGSRTGLARRNMFAIFKSSTTIRSYRAN